MILSRLIAAHDNGVAHEEDRSSRQVTENSGQGVLAVSDERAAKLSACDRVARSTKLWREGPAAAGVYFRGTTWRKAKAGRSGGRAVVLTCCASAVGDKDGGVDGDAADEHEDARGMDGVRCL
jgi:hypothetical protein